MVLRHAGFPTSKSRKLHDIVTFASALRLSRLLSTYELSFIWSRKGLGASPKANRSAIVMAANQSPEVQRREGLNVLISLCLLYTLCIFFMRIWIRRRRYAWDDLAATIATVSVQNCIYISLV